MADQMVFVIDDDPDNLDALTVLIEGAGYAVRGFTDPRAGLDAMRDDPPTAVCLDVQMPAMNGFQVLQAIREMPSLSATPVLFISAISAVTTEEYSPDSIQQQYGVRPDAFLAKPVTAEAVIRQLELLIPA